MTLRHRDATELCTLMLAIDSQEIGDKNSFDAHSLVTSIGDRNIAKAGVTDRRTCQCDIVKDRAAQVHVVKVGVAQVNVAEYGFGQVGIRRLVLASG